jgi:hypothetical protein
MVGEGLVGVTASYVEMVGEGLVGVSVGFGVVCEPLSLFGQDMEMTTDIYQIIKWLNSTRQNVCYNVLSLCVINNRDHSTVTRYDKRFGESS